jgi:uncharacterized membrane protein HdeD (DUF308 family)
VPRLTLEAREAAEEAAPFWWAFIGTGIAWILASLIILRFEYSSLTAISYLLGAVAIISAPTVSAIDGLIGQRSETVHRRCPLWATRC